MRKERPIIFSTEMVQAILEGRKTQTRRILKPKLQEAINFCDCGKAKDAVIEFRDNGHSGAGFYVYCSEYPDEGSTYLGPSPYGRAGDTLWVRESFAFIDNSDFDKKSYYEYKADKPKVKYPGNWPSDLPPNEVPLRWKPSIHMPRLAARIFLEVTDLRIERLNEITYEDIKREGIVTKDISETYWIATFAGLWDSLNYDRASWQSNPWVWVITFKRKEK